MKAMKILSQEKGIIVESEGFYTCQELSDYVIKDSKTRLVLGRYATYERLRIVFNEMLRNFVRPNKDYYSMPQK